MGEELLLTLDTSTTAGSIAISRGEKLLAEITLDSLAQHSDQILLQVQYLLDLQSIDMADFDAFAVINGPGSFTGLRVGVATAKGLASACNRPLFAVSSLAAVATTLPFAPLPVCVLLDARKKEIYTATFSTVTGELSLLKEPRAVAPHLLMEEMNEPAIFIGSGALLYQEMIKTRFGQHSHFAPWPLHAPRASSAAQIALKMMRNNEEGDPSRLLPFYIRPSEAELAEKIG